MNQPGFAGVIARSEMPQKMRRVNGYKLQHAIKELKEKRGVLFAVFDDCTRKFKDETKRDPGVVASEIEECEAAIVALQAAQALYNSSVAVELFGQKVPLLIAIKMVGGLGRVEGIWRDVVKKLSGGNRTSYQPLQTRDVDNEIEQFTVSLEVAQKKLQEASRRNQECREIVASGNAQWVEIEDDPVLDYVWS